MAGTYPCKPLAGGLHRVKAAALGGEWSWVVSRCNDRKFAVAASLQAVDPAGMGPSRQPGVSNCIRSVQAQEEGVEPGAVMRLDQGEDGGHREGHGLPGPTGLPVR